MADSAWRRAGEIGSATLRSPQTILALGIAMLFLFVYPNLVDFNLGGTGTRVLGLGLLCVSLASTLLTRGRGDEIPELSSAARLALLSLFLLAALTGEPLALRLVVTVVYAALFEIFHRSLRRSDSLIERLARSIEPAAPAFIRSYCRRVTELWSWFFLTNAILLAGLALLAPIDWWRSYSSWILYVEMGVIAVVEFLVRKTWFRYYFYGGPFDRLWSALFPADNTDLGRRSADYIRQIKARREARACHSGDA